MKIYKERQFLIFDFEDGKTVKYDFATKVAIGKKGLPVKNLCSQLSGLSIDSLCECCTDEKYGKFLRFVQRHGDYHHRGIYNIGTILDRVPKFSNFEQLFSAGIDEIVDSKFRYTINDIPKGLIKLCKNHQIKLSNKFLEYYKLNPDAYLLAYNLEYLSLSDCDIYTILSVEGDYVVRNEQGYYRDRIYYSRFNKLISDYGYTAKALLNYLDILKTFEAIENMDYLVRELEDYCNMMNKISPKFDKYPRHFLTTHKIACRNYNRLKEQFVEEDFKKRINKNMEKFIGNYCFIYPESTQDIKDEAVQQNNCVASYIKKVIEGNCHILFMRMKDSPDKSLVTIEVRNNKIVQARRRFNDPISDDEQIIVDKWNKWYQNNLCEEREELKNVS